MAIRAMFPKARQRIADGLEPPLLFKAQDWTPGPNYGRDRPQTFAERRAAYAKVIESVRRIEEGQRYRARRALIIDETPACQSLLRRIDDLQNLPFGMSVAREAAPLYAKLEAIIAGRMAEEAVAREEVQYRIGGMEA